jgi:hypothetical protein
MTWNGVLQLALYVVLLLILAKPFGSYMARVYTGRPVGLDRLLGWLERLIYRLSGVQADREMGWKSRPPWCWWARPSAWCLPRRAAGQRLEAAPRARRALRDPAALGRRAS